MCSGDPGSSVGHMQKAGFQDRTLSLDCKGLSEGTETRANCHSGPISSPRDPVGCLVSEAGIGFSRERILGHFVIIHD